MIEKRRLLIAAVWIGVLAVAAGAGAPVRADADPAYRVEFVGWSDGNALQPSTFEARAYVDGELTQGLTVKFLSFEREYSASGWRPIIHEQDGRFRLLCQTKSDEHGVARCTPRHAWEDPDARATADDVRYFASEATMPGCQNPCNYKENWYRAALIVDDHEVAKDDRPSWCSGPRPSSDC